MLQQAHKTPDSSLERLSMNTELISKLFGSSNGNASMSEDHFVEEYSSNDTAHGEFGPLEEFRRQIQQTLSRPIELRDVDVETLSAGENSSPFPKKLCMGPNCRNGSTVEIVVKDDELNKRLEQFASKFGTGVIGQTLRNNSDTVAAAVAAAVSKKKRQRRNPVWPYFDVADNVAKCKQCTYQTKSIYSTNLKVHLRTHHHSTYKTVIKAEEEQQAALQNALLSSTAVTSTNPFVHKVTTTALPSVVTNSRLTSSGGSSPVVTTHTNSPLSELLKSDNTKSQSNESQKMTCAVNSAPSTPPVLLQKSENDDLSTPSTSTAFDLTYSTLLSGGRIDESCLPAINQSASLSKRRRLRRHPVWRFFKDIDDTKSVGCIKCSFSTPSPFSTNLKMHLKAHHKEDYLLVLRLEAQQREEECVSGGPFINPKRKYSDETCDAASLMSVKDLKTFNNLLCSKKSWSMEDGFDEEHFAMMSTSERLKAMVDLATATQSKVDDDFGASIEALNIENEMNDSESFSDDFGVDQSLLGQLGLTRADLEQSSPLLQKNNFLSTQSPTLNTTVLRNQLMATPTVSPVDTSKSVRTVSKKLPTGEVVKVRQMRKDHSDVSSHNTESMNCSPTPALTPAVAGNNGSSLRLPKESSQVSRDEALALLLHKTKSFYLLGIPEFKHFVETLAPDYALPSSGSLKRMIEKMPVEKLMNGKTIEDLEDELE